MLLGLIRFLRGYVTFKISGRFPERFINLALKNGIGIFGALPKEGYLTASMVISDYKVIRPLAKRCSVRLKIQSRVGLPFIIFKYRRRWGLGVGIILFIIISLFMQNFVWSMELNGVKSISETGLKASLQEAGFAEGRFKGSMNLSRIENKILLEYEEIGWMSINLLGTHAQVEIKEKSPVPQKEYSSGYSNIFASSDGVILSTNISRGTAKTKAGSAVSKGQLLVSGMYENALGDVHFVDAEAEIIASTCYKFTASIAEEVTRLKPADYKNRSKIRVFWFDIPITFAPEEPLSTFYDENYQVHIYDTPIPLTVSRQQLVNYDEEIKNITKEEAENILKTELSLYKLFNLKDTKSLTDEYEIIKEENYYKIEAVINCTEDIARKENLIVNEE